jgi:hypothetical protein
MDCYILAKIHCVADSDCENQPKDVACLPFTLIPQETEKTIRDAIQARDQQFVDDMVEFGMVNGWRRINRTVLFRLYLIHFSSQRRDLSLKRFPIQFSTKLYKRG